MKEGILKPNTPICVIDKEGKVKKIGLVESIEHNKKSIKEAKQLTGSVAVCIKGDSSIMAGRHFSETD